MAFNFPLFLMYGTNARQTLQTCKRINSFHTVGFYLLFRLNLHIHVIVIKSISSIFYASVWMCVCGTHRHLPAQNLIFIVFTASKIGRERERCGTDYYYLSRCINRMINIKSLFSTQIFLFCPFNVIGVSSWHVFCLSNTLTDINFPSCLWHQLGLVEPV